MLSLTYRTKELLMQVRLAEPSDVNALIQLYGYLSSGYVGNPDAVLEAIAHPTTFVYVLCEDGISIGTATLSVRAVPCAGLVGYVDDVVVNPAFRGRGLAKILLNNIESAARKKRCIRIELSVNASRIAARRLYERLGYIRRNTDVFRLDLQ